MANALRAAGIADGDVVAYGLLNDADTAIVQLATSEIGLRYLSLNPSLSSDEFAAILHHSTHIDTQSRWNTRHFDGKVIH